MKTLILAIVGFLMCGGTLSAAEIPYRFATLPTDTAIADINDKGDILVSGTSPGAQPFILRNNRKVRNIGACQGFAEGFDPATLSNVVEAFSFTDKHIVGYCAAGDATGEARISGFIIGVNGTSQVLLDAPGAGATVAKGINADGYVAGTFWDRLGDSHCFMWKPSTGFTVIDYPVSNTSVDCTSINKAGQMLGEYVTFNPDTNEGLEHGFFIWDNGNFSVPLPLSHDFEGGPSWYAYDFNDDGAILGYHAPNDGNPASLFLFDDGILFTVTMPQDWYLSDLGGVNNRGEFVGRIYIDRGVDPVCFEEMQDEDYCTIYEGAGFKASPDTKKTVAVRRK